MIDSLGQQVNVNDLIVTANAYGFDKGVFVQNAGTIQFYPLSTWNEGKVDNGNKPYKSYIYGERADRRVVKIPRESLSDTDQVIYDKIVKFVKGI